MKRFNFPINSVLPLVFDDSLSYYEVLSKMSKKINEIIESNNLLSKYLGAYTPTYEGDWMITRNYEPLDYVTHDLKMYIAKKDVPAGTQITNNEYWEELKLPYFESISKMSKLDFCIPDQFEGTDSQKIQQAFDTCVNGGIIVMNRSYKLTDHIIIKHKTSRQEEFVYFIGLGKHNVLDLNGYSIMGDIYTAELVGRNSLGGIYFENINFKGKEAQNGFIVDLMIRMYFDNCHFHGMLNVFYSHDTIIFKTASAAAFAQSYYFTNCYFGSSKNAAFNVYQCWDTHFTNTIFEYENSVVEVRNHTQGLFIESCLMENFVAKAAVKIAGDAYNVSIRDTYFEDNAFCVDLYDVTYTCGGLLVDSCHFCPNATNQNFIKLPRDMYDFYPRTGSPRVVYKPAFTISNNAMYPTKNAVSDCYALFVGDNTYRLDGVTIFNNNFGYNHSNIAATEIIKLGVREVVKSDTLFEEEVVYVNFNSIGNATNSFPCHFSDQATSDIFWILSIADVQTGARVDTPNSKFKIAISSGGYANLTGINGHTEPNLANKVASVHFRFKRSTDELN